MLKKEIKLRNVKSGKEVIIKGIKEAAKYLGVSTYMVYNRSQNNIIVDDIQIIIPNKVKYNTIFKGKHIYNKEYTIDYLMPKTAVFSSSIRIMEGDTEKHLNDEISAYVKENIKDSEHIEKKFILTVSTFKDKLFYEVVFLFKKDICVDEMSDIILRFLPY